VATLDKSDLIDEMLDVRGRDVLDVGCGEGWLVRRLVERGAASVVGIDPLAVALEHARTEGPPELVDAYLDGSAEALPFADRSFDIVVFFNSLHHVPKESLDAAVAEALRVLRPRGLIYVQEPVPTGEFHELMSPIEDETDMRVAAQAALDRAIARRRMTERSRRDAVVGMTFADFAALRALMISVEPERGALIHSHEAELHEGFERLGREVEGGREFELPVRTRIFAAR
jgi:ubiquinone/menaquinone biosynthesis C-methylase UbiE